MDEVSLYEVTGAITKINAAADKRTTEIVLEKKVVLALRHLLRVMRLLDMKLVDGKICDYYRGVAIRYEA